MLTQTPARQASVVQALPSSHFAPSALAGFEHIPVAGSQVPAVWHMSLAAQVTAGPPVQTPATQVSLPVVQAFPSSHLAPSALAGFEHMPVVGSQVPPVWHWSLAGQAWFMPPVHMPFLQVSPVVHIFPSSQVVPSGLAGSEHMPVAGSQVPAEWHESLAVQAMVVPVHTPALHESPVVQALPSLHVAPSAFAGFEHMPVAGSQVPTEWQESLAVQAMVAPPVQTPALQESPVVQASPSLQAAPSALAGFEHIPVVESQVPAVWHWSLAAQVFVVVGVQTPALQASPVVQALPSLQVVPSAAVGLVHAPVVVLHVPAT